jgi:transposase-like protein
MEEKEVMVMNAEKKGEEMEGARRATGISSPGASHKYRDTPIVPDTEVTEKANRRRFTAEYKRSIIRKADALREHGQIGALLRREGLYYSNLDTWRRQAERGTLDALSKNRGPRAKRPDKAARRIKEQEKEILKLKAELKKAGLIIEAQKKITEIFQISLDQEKEES